MDTQFLEEVVEYLIDQLHVELDHGNSAEAEVIARKIRELQEV
jgi:hypothetical protein